MEEEEEERGARCIMRSLGPWQHDERMVQDNLESALTSFKPCHTFREEVNMVPYRRNQNLLFTVILTRLSRNKGAKQRVTRIDSAVYQKC